MGFRPTVMIASKKVSRTHYRIAIRYELPTIRPAPRWRSAGWALISFLGVSLTIGRLPRMQARDEIVKQIDKLSPEMQQQVLRFVASLAASMPKGECGAVLRQFSGSLDAVSAQQMIQAIEEECERVDAGEW